ncbi:hypothetical protein J6590_063946 [Homalodisca vitripennis]|nr:hypothetical protein J6590_063946 [Homalodisca vitripennis]
MVDVERFELQIQPIWPLTTRLFPLSSGSKCGTLLATVTPQVSLSLCMLTDGHSTITVKARLLPCNLPDGHSTSKLISLYADHFLGTRMLTDGVLFFSTVCYFFKPSCYRIDRATFPLCWFGGCVSSLVWYTTLQHNLLSAGCTIPCFCCCVPRPSCYRIDRATFPLCWFGGCVSSLVWYTTLQHNLLSAGCTIPCFCCYVPRPSCYRIDRATFPLCWFGGCASSLVWYTTLQHNLLNAGCTIPCFSDHQIHFVIAHTLETIR